MKPWIKAFGVGVVSAGLLMSSGCMGSFTLTKKVYKWNQHATGERWVNEIIFIVGLIVPVYHLTLLGDGLIFNSIEWWSGHNPIADAGSQKRVKGEDGSEALMTLNADGSIKVDAVSAEGEKTTFTLEKRGDQVTMINMVSSRYAVAGR